MAGSWNPLLQGLSHQDEYPRRFSRSPSPFRDTRRRAIAEANQKATSSEDAGDEEQAKFWRRVEAALLEIRGPGQS
jgi:hypothetical protein